MNREPSTPNKAARIVAGVVALGTIGLITSNVMKSDASNTNCDFEGCPPATDVTGSTIHSTLPEKEATTVAPTTTVVETSLPATTAVVESSVPATTTTVAETTTTKAPTTTVVESSVPASSTTTTVAETPTIPASTTTVPATVPVPVTAPGHTA